MKWVFVFAALGLSSCIHLSESDESICAKMNTYENAPFNENTKSRSVTLKWVGDWMDFENGFGKECEFTEDQASKSLCGWLSENTSTEFQNGAPISILQCYGYEFPSASTWSGWRSQIDIWGQRDEPILLEVDLTDSTRREPSIRITIFADGHGTYDDDFVPLF